MQNDYAVQMKNITKSFGSVVANDHIDLEIRHGEILSILGENGSGKTTLMNMLAGIYYPDEGEIFIDGKLVSIQSPKDAFEHGIGMVHQHFKLVNVLSAAENVILGLPGKPVLDLKEVKKKIKDICSNYNFILDPDKKVFDMSVSEKQTLEIVKVLYRGANILILDEPTAVLTPQETETLFDVIRLLKADGKSVVIITHKLNEVMEISDRVSVLRKGAFIGNLNTKDTNPQEMTNMMVGRTVTLNISRSDIDPEQNVDRLVVKDLTVVDGDGITKLDHVSFTARGGEILGIAGIAGSGQKELLESISGLQPIKEGSIMYTRKGSDGPVELVGMSPIQIMKAGVALAFVPEDRLGMGLVGNMGMTDNMLLRSWMNDKGIFIHKSKPHTMADFIKEDLEIVTPDTEYPVRRLSGGNVQKVLVGREIWTEPTVFMSAYAVRGLDINTSYTIYNSIDIQKQKGVAVIYIGEDLDVLLELCDRILVMYEGKVTGIVDARTATKDEVGLLMTTLPSDDADDKEGR